MESAIYKLLYGAEVIKEFFDINSSEEYVELKQKLEEGLPNNQKKLLDALINKLENAIIDFYDEQCITSFYLGFEMGQDKEKTLIEYNMKESGK